MAAENENDCRRDNAGNGVMKAAIFYSWQMRRKSWQKAKSSIMAKCREAVAETRENGGGGGMIWPGVEASRRSAMSAAESSAEMAS